MVNKTFVRDEPIVIGLCGQAGAGKTTVAEGLVPQGLVAITDKVQWDHLYFASPLYEMASIKRTIQGEQQKERVLYALTDVVFNLFGRSPLYGAPPFNKLIKTVKAIEAMPIEPDGVKPRTFMQEAGTLCRKVKPDCFVQRVKQTIKINNLNRDTEAYVAVVSDVRMKNEAEMISSLPNGLVVKLVASDQTRAERIENRDGVQLTAKQLAHESEKMNIPAELISCIIDTEDITPQDSVDLVKANIPVKLEGAPLA